MRDLTNLIGEDTGPRKTCWRDRKTRFGMDLPHCMEAIRNVFFRRGVATPLLRHDMDQDGFMQGSCTIKDLFHRCNIVAVNRSQVLQSKVLKHCLRNERVFNTAFEAVKSSVSCASRLPKIHQSPFTPRQRLFVISRRTQKIKMTGYSTNSWRIGASVVINDDDCAPLVIGSNVV